MYEIKYHNKDISKLTFLVTGGAGFIGSNLVEYLLKYNAGKVRVLDNLSNGYINNITPFLSNPSFEFIEADIRDLDVCLKACENVDFILHQAALGSVPRSINDPINTNSVNITGFLNMLVAARDTNVKRFVYAASSSTYGDSPILPKQEDIIGKPLSPYAVTKYVNELYADVFAKTYGMETIGLRYFNVFGPRQDPNCAYAAVIPLFMKAVIEGKSATINGDGETTRDFTFVENVIQANMKALFVENKEAINQIYNVACGEKTSLNELWNMINKINGVNIKSIHIDTRIGDIKDSLADINKSRQYLNFCPDIKIFNGLEITEFFFKQLYK